MLPNERSVELSRQAQVELPAELPVEHAALALHSFLEAQRHAAAEMPFPSEDQRKRWLSNLLTLVKDHQDEWCAAINADFGCHPQTEVLISEVFPSVQAIRHCRKQVGRWMKPRKAKVSLWFKPAKARVLPQPLGCVGIMVPWNYPLYLTIAPLAAALAAGNRVLLKPSEYSPHFGALLQQLVARYFSPDEVQIVLGDADTARAFSALPLDHLLFTGSTDVGKQVMRAAAANLTPVTLELGGKSPVIFGPDVNLPLATKRLLVGKLLKAGQICIAPDYLLLPVGQEHAFLAQAKQHAQKLLPQWPLDFASMATEKQWQRLQDLLADAQAKGARIEKLFDAQDSGRHLVPRLLFNCHDDMRIMQEEVFGPLLPVMGYRALVDCIAYINARPRPLALYYFGDHDNDVERITHETHSGGVCVNHCLLHVSQDSLPFGGVGASGMGHYHGEYGFNTFSKLKGIFEPARHNLIPLMYPPYTKLTRLILKLMIR